MSSVLTLPLTRHFPMIPSNRLNFFIPVTYMPKARMVSPKSFSSKLAEFADRFFQYQSVASQAFVTGMKDKNYKVSLITCKTPAWKIALRILLLPLAPIFLAIKMISRAGKNFQVTETLSPAKKFTVLKYERPSSIDLTKTKEHYKTICKQAGIKLGKTTPLQKHVLFFTDEHGKITKKSLQKKFEELHTNKFTSKLLSLIIFSTFAKHMKVKTPYFTLNDITTKGTHEASTGVFNADGTLNKEKFDALRKKFPTIDPDYLTADDIIKMRKFNADQDAGKKNIGTGKLASKGEFNFTLNLFSDGVVVDSYGKTTPAISLDRLKRLYKEGPLLFEEVAKKT